MQLPARPAGRLGLLLLASWARSAAAVRVGAQLVSAEAKARAELVQYTNGSHCGYGKEDVYTAKSAAKEKPKKGPGSYLRGFAAGALQLGRAVVGARVLALALQGKDAAALVQAQYGIVTAKVSPRCFDELYGYLQQPRDKTHKLRHFLQFILPRGCGKRKNIMKEMSETTGEPANTKKLTVAELKQDVDYIASKILLALRHGLWSLYEPLTSNASHTISARVLDKLRGRRNDYRLRQIWHYGRNHLRQILELLLRDHILKAKAKSHREDLLAQMKVVVKLEGVRNARLTHVELDILGNCVSAQKHDVANILTALREQKSADYRVVLYFEERWWQWTARSAGRFLAHPISSFHKYVSRTKDEWGRSTTGHKVMMIIQPILKAAAIAGTVLGVASCGTTTLATVMVNALGISALEHFASSTMVSFIVSKVVGAVAVDVVSEDLLGSMESDLTVQQVLGHMDDTYVAADARARLADEVDMIMRSPELEQVLEAQLAQGEGGEEQAEEVQEEVHRYVEGMVYQGFLQEVTTRVLEMIEQRARAQDPKFGWLTFKQWKLYAKHKTSWCLLGHSLRFGDGREGRVVSVATKIFFDRMIEVQFDGEKEPETVTLSKHLKKGLWVFDKDAYRKSRVGWLIWEDWQEYRGKHAKDSARLLGKEIYYDEDLPGCGKVPESLSCIVGQDKDKRGVTVTRIGWKVLGLGSRAITVDAASRDRRCKRFGFLLKSRVKACLQVRDSKAYKAFLADTPRVDQERKWRNADLSAVPPTFPDEVAKNMSCAGGDAKAAEAANELLQKELGAESAALEMESQGRCTTDEEDEEESLEVCKFLEEGLRARAQDC